MKTKNLILIFFIMLLVPISLLSQVEPDSLIGTYAGERWFKWEEDTEWTITNDTAYIFSIDTTNGCWVTEMLPVSLPSGTGNFETYYDFCFGNSDNLFTRFHSFDSLSIVYNDISQPPPNYHVWSARFYGKKISSDILLDDVEENNTENEHINIFPNPFNNQLNIQVDANEEYIIKVFDINGKELSIETIKNQNQVTINSECFNPSVYILQIIFNKKIKSYKIIKF